MQYNSTLQKVLLSAFFIFFIHLSFTHGQYTVQQCQTVSDALIDADRNDFVYGPGGIINEGYLHNFNPPVLPCGINNPNLTSLVVTIDITSITASAACTGIPIFGNVLRNCPLPGVCTIIEEVLTPGCGMFGGGATAPSFQQRIS